MVITSSRSISLKLILSRAILKISEKIAKTLVQDSPLIKMVGVCCFRSNSSPKSRKTSSISENDYMDINLYPKPKYMEKKLAQNQDDSLMNYWKLLNKGLDQIPDESKKTNVREEDLRQFAQIERHILQPKLNIKDFHSTDKQTEILGTYGSIRQQKILLVSYKFKKENVFLTIDKSKATTKTLTDVENTFSLKTFLNEIAVLKSCNHENIIKFKGVVLDPKFFCLVTESEGKKLSNFLFNGEIEIWWETSITDLIDIGLEVIQGLRYLHGSDIIHRDIRSSNIRLYSNDKQKFCTKIANFSLAYSSTHGFGYFNKSKMGLNIHAGKPRWMAPEIQSVAAAESNQNKTNVDRYSTKSDIYAYGVTLGEIFSAMLPFWSVDRQELKSLIGLGRLHLNELEVRNDVPSDLLKEVLL
ncbi:Raf serine threonine- kinase phl -like protein [Brachionus plicatilis]|uniref:Raf serine threonine-kinase phl-like protein n=1 Tax=Brachionus plicatilis TaxID=10195 RepID=A0A3M7RH91_BRAPC|nr:Raf serine threonine- kinase phl -like protein [Brachionus plicatilis]